MDDPTAVLRVSGVTVSVGARSRRVRLVDDVGFMVGRNETVGLVGESGCGKSITALAVLGLLPRGCALDGGSVLLAGDDLARMKRRELNAIRGRRIGAVFQQPFRSLHPAFTIGQQIAEILGRHLGLSRPEARTRAIDLLDRVRIPQPAVCFERYPHELSGGMCQRVMIAAAIACDPELLIADEPTTALDVTVQADILDLLRELQADNGMGVVLITHDLGVVADACDRVVVMYSGRVVESAPAAQLLTEPSHPYAAGLLSSTPRLEGGGRLEPIPGSVAPPSQWPVGCRFSPRCDRATGDCIGTEPELVALTPSVECRCFHPLIGLGG